MVSPIGRVPGQVPAQAPVRGQVRAHCKKCGGERVFTNGKCGDGHKLPGPTKAAK